MTPPAFLHHPLIYAYGFAHDRTIADTPLAIDAIWAPVGTTYVTFANVVSQTVTCLNAACPGGTFVVEACLVGLRSFDAVKPVWYPIED